jgi:hypothetical protein
MKLLQENAAFGQSIYIHQSVTLPEDFIFWNITPCSPLKADPCFGGACRIHLQVRKINQARNQRESKWQADPTAFRIQI